VPEKYQALVSANPVTFLTESFRYCLLGVGTVSWEAGIYSVVATVVVLLGGLYRFNKTARTFVDIA
jgi:lipopolysaccharide transport system permease protein